jgi:hypothetical protein
VTDEKWMTGKAQTQFMVLNLSDRRVPRTKAGRRKLRLLACGCCRFIWDLIPDDRLREAVAVAERFAEGQASKAELVSARTATEGLRGITGLLQNGPGELWVAIDMAAFVATEQALDAAIMMTATAHPLAGKLPKEEAEAYMRSLLRDVFGNIIRPVGFDSSWRTSTIITLARQMYDSRDFSAIPILADALQDAGCDNDAILTHCREPGPHVRGCWVCDLCLAKE